MSPPDQASSKRSPADADGALPRGQKLSRKDLLLALSGIACATVIAAFDATIISTILPQVALALDGMTLYAWVGTGYFLACSLSILIFGRLGDLFGRKPLLMLSLVLVSLGSGLSAFAQNMEQLIAFRVLQGVGGGMMIATAFAAPADLLPDAKERVRWMALLSSTFAVSSGIGPVLGGAVTQTFGWRASFFLIPIIGLIAMPVIWKFFPRMRPVRKTPFSFDWLGTLLLSVTVAFPLVALEWLTSSHSEVPGSVGATLLLVAAMAGWGLYLIEKRVAMPIFPLRILQTVQSRLLNMGALIAGAIMFMLIYYIPLLSQDVFGYSPTVAGLMISPLVAGLPVGSVINGRMFQREPNPQRLMKFGSVMLGLGCALTLTLSASTPVWYSLVVMGICGFGLGFLIPNFTLFMQMITRREDVGISSALIQTTRALGSALGTALVGTLIAELSIQTGLRIGLIVSVLLCVLLGWLSTKVKMGSFAAS